MLRHLFIAAIVTFSIGCYGHNIDSLMMRAGLIEATSVEPTFLVDLRYSTTDNFMHLDAYGELETAYMVPELARRLAVAQAMLKEQGYCLKIWDAARPLSVQRIMWAIVKGTKDSIYVAKPYRGGMHNYGAAVDVTIVDMATGKECDMGTPFDHFGSSAWTSSPLATPQRAILIDAMSRARLKVYSKEWWHYEMEELSANDVRSGFTLLDF